MLFINPYLCYGIQSINEFRDENYQFEKRGPFINRKPRKVDTVPSV